MKILDNISDLLGDNLKAEISPGERLSLCAATFSVQHYRQGKRVFHVEAGIAHRVLDLAMTEKN
jgi:hypothetical protein